MWVVPPVPLHGLRWQTFKTTGVGRKSAGRSPLSSIPWSVPQTEFSGSLRTGYVRRYSFKLWPQINCHSLKLFWSVISKQLTIKYAAGKPPLPIRRQALHIWGWTLRGPDYPAPLHNRPWDALKFCPQNFWNPAPAQTHTEGETSWLSRKDTQTAQWTYAFS